MGQDSFGYLSIIRDQIDGNNITQKMITILLLGPDLLGCTVVVYPKDYLGKLKSFSVICYILHYNGAEQ